jgi:hypothetical protein
MKQQNQTDIACNHWVAQVRSRSGSNVVIHIHRGAPIVAKDAMSIARRTANFGKVAGLSPIGPCALVSDDEC